MVLPKAVWDSGLTGFEEQPRGIGEGAGRIERRLAHLVEPVGRRRVHRAIDAPCDRRAAKFANRHFPGPRRLLLHCSIVS